MKSLTLSALTLSLAACDVEDYPPTSYVCSEPEMVRVENETKFCIDNDVYFANYCYQYAISRNCNPRVETK